MCFFQADLKNLHSVTASQSIHHASSTNRSMNAYYKHLNRFNIERSTSRANLNRSAKSGRPGILKPLKLMQAEDKEQMEWICGNLWAESNPKYLRSKSGNLTKLQDFKQQIKCKYI